MIGRYGTPFVVAHRLALGGLVFLAGRLALVVFHELAHGLAMASLGRHVNRAGLKLLLIFPYVFVDTSEAWFESRARRIAVSAAGPLSDLTLAGTFSTICLLAPKGTLQEIVFQLAFAAFNSAEWAFRDRTSLKRGSTMSSGASITRQSASYWF